MERENCHLRAGPGKTVSKAVSQSNDLMIPVVMTPPSCFPPTQCQTSEDAMSRMVFGFIKMGFGPWSASGPEM